MRNRFVINHSQDLFKHAPLRLEASIFLRDIVPLNALHFLRHLEFVCPLVDDGYLRPHDSPFQECSHDPPYQDWMRTIDLVKEKLCLPLLTVRFYITDYLPNGLDFTSYRENQSQNTLVMVFQTCTRISRPLWKFRGLKGFFVHLTWPVARRVEGQAEYLKTLELIAKFRYIVERIQMCERHLERAVMGSEYDSMALQKEQLRKSQWLEIALNSIELD